jgi:uncharacterized protein (UPF0212 family)
MNCDHGWEFVPGVEIGMRRCPDCGQTVHTISLRDIKLKIYDDSKEQLKL